MSESITSDFLRVLLTLKKSTLKDCNVAQVYKVENIESDGTCFCRNINNTDAKLTAHPLYNLEITTGDVVVVIFTDTDFRNNLKKIKNGQATINVTETEDVHSVAFGIIIGILYHKEVEYK